MISQANTLTLHHDRMTRKNTRQKKARTPRKSDRVGLSAPASTPTFTTEKKRIDFYDRELRRLMGAKVSKT